MKPGFANILSYLRHEKSLSQKKVADDLGISQALLSHYENGVREPKLEFIIKACEYYEVSTDYILGRTHDKSFGGTALNCRSDGEKRNADTAALIIAMLAEIGDEALCDSAAQYFNFSIFVILTALRAPMNRYDPLFDAAFKRAESFFIVNVQRLKLDPEMMKKLLDDTLREKFPEQFTAMRELEEIVGQAVSSLTHYSGKE